MIIVNREKFLELPGGTVFSLYEPCFFTGLRIKGEGWQPDFVYQDLIGNINSISSGQEEVLLEEAERDGATLRFDFDCYQRDGMFEPKQLFAIYDKQDLKELILALTGAFYLANNS